MPTIRRLAIAFLIVAGLVLITAIWSQGDRHENVSAPVTPVLDSIHPRVQVRFDSTAAAEQARLDSLFSEYHRERLNALSRMRASVRSA